MTFETLVQLAKGQFWHARTISIESSTLVVVEGLNPVHFMEVITDLVYSGRQLNDPDNEWVGATLRKKLSYMLRFEVAAELRKDLEIEEDDERRRVLDWSN